MKSSLKKSGSKDPFYLDLVKALYRDIAQCYNVHLSTQRVEQCYIDSRYAAEGISFLTKTLPAFGKAVDKAISTGSLLSTPGLKKAKGSVIPKLFGWLLSRVFDAKGKELDCPDPKALKHFKQLTVLLYKLEIPHESDTNNSIYDSFALTDASLPDPDGDPDIISMGHVLDLGAGRTATRNWLETTRKIITRVVSPLDPFDIKPKHGPGSVATRECVTAKKNLRRIYQHLEEVYPFTEWMLFNLNHVAQACIDKDGYYLEIPEATARVVLVPKDSRGPRLISCEPLEVQWIQQGLGRALVNQIQSHRWTSGYVNFTDQEVNRDLALEGSIGVSGTLNFSEKLWEKVTGASHGQQWVTLDMKDASDRVSLCLVKYLFQDHPWLLKALLACRSPLTRLPNGSVIRLKKFAPMGSALCFPVEALVFWALSVSAIYTNTGSRLSEARRSVYVYGDDIIVKRSDYQSLFQYLPLVGLKFNENKCCTARFYRESCGCDAYDGVDITPVKLKTVWSYRRTDPTTIASYVAFTNAMLGLGHYETAELVTRKLKHQYGNIPHTTRNYSAAPNGTLGTSTSGFAFCAEGPYIPAAPPSCIPENSSPRGVESMVQHGGQQRPPKHRRPRVGEVRYNADYQRLEVCTLGSEPLKARVSGCLDDYRDRKSVV